MKHNRINISVTDEVYNRLIEQFKLDQKHSPNSNNNFEAFIADMLYFALENFEEAQEFID